MGRSYKRTPQNSNSSHQPAKKRPRANSQPSRYYYDDSSDSDTGGNEVEIEDAKQVVETMVDLLPDAVEDAINRLEAIHRNKQKH